MSMKKERVCSCCNGNRIKVYRIACDVYESGCGNVARCVDCGSRGLVRETEDEALKSFDKINKAIIPRLKKIREREEEAKAAADELQKQKRERERM